MNKKVYFSIALTPLLVFLMLFWIIYPAIFSVEYKNYLYITLGFLLISVIAGAAVLVAIITEKKPEP